MPLSNAKKPREKTGPQVVASGWSSYDYEKNKKESQAQRFQRKCLTYAKIRQLRNDPTVQLARMAVVAPMIHTPWSYKVNEKRLPKSAAELLESCFSYSRNWLLQDAIYGAMDFGWQGFELLFENTDAVRIREFKPLLQDITNILTYRKSGAFAGFENNPNSLEDKTVIEESYALNINLVREGTSHYGYSLFESLFGPITNWDQVEDTANKYDRKIAGATWVVEYPVGTNWYNGLGGGNDFSDDSARIDNELIAADILRRLEASGGIAIPSEIQDWLGDSVEKEYKNKWKISLISANASNQGGFVDRQKYLDALKIRVFGLPERSILEGSHGTKEEASVHTDIAISTIDTKHRLFCDTLNKNPVKTIITINYGEKYSRDAWIEPAPIIDAQINNIKEIYRSIVQTPDLAAQEVTKLDLVQIRQQLGLPQIGQPI